MATITQTLNADARWSGTIPADALATGITAYRLYCAQNADQPSAYRLVEAKTNPGTGTITFGPYTYAGLYLNTPTRKFFLRVTAMRGSQEDDLVGAANPVLSVTPSDIKGWTLEQLLEQDIRPAILVGYDPINKLFYPLNVVSDGGTGYKLKT